ncbi:MAG: alanyl-tRNA editing protein [Geminicoccaceae bacterium]|nr:alanyl-tRNA editing protein [Geminicoccaceae bacterium]
MTEPLFRSDAYARTCEALVLTAGPEGIVLDRTVFYPTGGGQPGDRGVLVAAHGAEIAILDTRKGEGEAILHLPAADAPLPPPGTRVSARIDGERRYRLMRAHTALHLLSAAVAAPVTGGAVGELEGRLDFDLPEPSLDREAIEAKLAAWVAADLPVRAQWIEEAQLDARPELVKTMWVRPPRGAGRIRLVEIEGVDLQACGGTHVARTGEIGRVRITKIEKKGRQNRRIAIAIEG